LLILTLYVACCLGANLERRLPKRRTQDSLLDEMQEREFFDDDFLEAGEYERAGRQVLSSCATGDVVFVVDSSGSIGADNWVKALRFIADVIGTFPIGLGNSKVAMTTFGNRAHIIFYLTNFTDASSLRVAVLATPFLDQNTNTSGGIYVGHKILLSPANGGTPGGLQTLVVVTDGVSTYDHNLTIPYANEAKAAGINIVVVGVGKLTDPNELKAMASQKGDSALVFNAGDFDSMTSLKDPVAQSICQIP